MRKETVVVTLYPGCISFEVALAAELLSKKYQILNATPDGQDLTDSTGLPLKAQLSYAQVKLEDCRAVLVPGGNPDCLIQNKEIDRILVEANKAHLLIGGICAGPSVLGKAGILKGRKIAHGYGEAQLEYLKDIFNGVTLTSDPFLVDGNIITAKPDAYIDFAVEIGCKLGVIAPDKKEGVKDYYRGLRAGAEVKPYRSTYLSHVEIYVSNYRKSIQFYDKVLLPLGWKRLVCQKSHTTYSDGSMKIVFCPTDDKYLKDGYHRKRVGMNHLAFYAQSKETVNRLHQEVLAPNAIDCLYEGKPTGEDDYYAVFFEDPDRIKIEVVYSPGYCSEGHWTNRIENNFDPYSEAPFEKASQ